MSRFDRGLRALLSLGVGLAALSTTLAAAPLSAAAPATVTHAATHRGKAAPPAPTLTPASPVVGEAVHVSGTLPTKATRPVSLQQRTGGAWSTVAKGRTSGKGTYAFEAPPAALAGASQWRVTAPKATIRKKGRRTRLPALTSAVREVTFVDQALSASFPMSGTPGRPVPATVTLTPARPGRTVSVERLTGGGWHVVASAVQGVGADLQLSVPQPAAGPGTPARTEVLRVVAASHRGIPVLASGPSSVAIAAVPVEPDTQAPPVPTGVTGTAGDGQVALSWTAVDADDLAGYTVYRALGPNGSWTAIGTTTAPAYVASSLVNGTEYAFAIASFDASGNQSDRSTPLLRTPIVVQTGTLALPAQTFVNKEVTASASFTPALPGRTVHLQVLDAGTWSTVAEGLQDAQGVADLTLVALSAGTFTYRAVAIAVPASPEAVSTTNEVTVAPDPVVVDEHVEPLTEGEVQAATYSPDSGSLSFGVDAPESVASITAGDVVAVPPRSGLPAGALLRVTNVSVEGGVRTLSTTGADLPEVVSNVPDDATEIAMSMIGTPTVTSVADGVTVEDNGGRSGPGLPAQRLAGQGLVSLDGDPIKASVELKLTKKVGAATFTALVGGSVTVTPTVELGLDMDWATLRSYRVGAGFKVDEHLGISASVAAQVEWSKTLFKVSATRGGFIGPVPVWATLTGKVVVTVTADGQVKAGIEWNRNGTFMVGIEGSNHDQYVPHPFHTSATSQGTFSAADAAGHVHGEIVGSAQLDLYSLAGPYAEIGYEADGTVRATSQGPLACELYHRPVASVGIRTSDALKKLTGKQFTLAEAKVEFAKNVIASCPGDPPTGPPEIATTSLHDATLGRAYSATLETTDGRPGTWSVTAGVLPEGLHLDLDTGEIDGTTSGGVGHHAFSVTFDDHHGGTVSRPLSIEVATDVAQAGDWVHAPSELPATQMCPGCLGYALSEDLTLSNAVPGYWFNSASLLVVPAGRTLTITEGTRLKMGHCGYYSSDAQPCIVVAEGGTLRILGTAENPVVFTSAWDDQVGGDTNAGTPYSDDPPSPGTYMGLGLSAGATVEVDHAQFRYAHTAIRDNGGASGWIDHSRFVDSFRGVEGSTASLPVRSSVFDRVQYGVLTGSPDVKLVSNTFRDTTFGIYAGGARTVVRDSTFTDVYYGIQTYDTAGTLTDNRFTSVHQPYRAMANGVPTISGSRGDAVALTLLPDPAPVTSGSVVTWDVDVPIVLTRPVEVQPGGELRLSAGTRIRSDDCRVYASSSPNDCLVVRDGGQLTVLGRQARPVVWTSLYDDTVGGDIGHDGVSVASPYDARGFVLEGGATASVSHLEMTYVANPLRADPGAELALDHSSITEASGTGLVAGGEVHVDSTVFDSPSLITALALSGAGSTVTNSLLARAYRGVQTSGPDLVLGGNRFEGFSGGPAVQNLGPSQVDARNNWWGSPDGPTSEPPTPEQPAHVVGDVLVAPWCTDASCGAD